MAKGGFQVKSKENDFETDTISEGARDSSLRDEHDFDEDDKGDDNEKDERTKRCEKGERDEEDCNREGPQSRPGFEPGSLDSKSKVMTTTLTGRECKTGRSQQL